MIITIDETASEPLYKQIHDQVIAGIATGQLEPGMSLPSVRSLASDLGINLHTVNKAYAILRDEGYVQCAGVLVRSSANRVMQGVPRRTARRSQP